MRGPLEGLQLFGVYLGPPLNSVGPFTFNHPRPLSSNLKMLLFCLQAVEIGKVIARKHFIHHVFRWVYNIAVLKKLSICSKLCLLNSLPFTCFIFRENDFEDGNHLYRFLEHEPIIPRCFNFRGSANDSEAKPAAVMGRKLAKIMLAILEAYATEDCRHVDYARISKSEEFRR